MTRQRAYFALRGGAGLLFVLSATALPHGAPALIGCSVAGAVSLFTCMGVNAGGPGEQAGARAEHLVLDRTRAPQGDWPPYDDTKVIDGETIP